MRNLNSFVVLLGAVTNFVGSVDGSFCRCIPGNRCWPSLDTWASLNSSIDGNLVAVVPVASPCHDPNYDAAACAIVTANSTNSVFLSAQPGALQWQNWEAWPDKNQQCYVGSPQSTPCGQGRVSLYSAEVETAAQIQATVQFAGKHNLKLAIKNSGHDFLGRSSSPDSLQISTYKMKTTIVNSSFVPEVNARQQAPAPVQAVTVAAGVQMHDMYQYLGSQNVMVVGGSSNTVGIAGGYLQGGGHSLMGWIAGMSTDNVLEFEVVTANGSLVRANAYKNTDLFWALRGGGGGTWGVVVSATVKTYPNYPVLFCALNFTTLTSDTHFWDGIEAFHTHLVPLSDAGGTGYYYITPIVPVPVYGDVATFVLYMWFVNQTNPDFLAPLYDSLIATLEAATGVTPAFEIIPFPSMSYMYGAIYTGADMDGALVQLGSRLISRDFVNSPSAPAKIASKLSTLLLGPNDYIEGNVVAGGQVAANANIDSALNPAWRKTVVHLLFIRQWLPSTTFAEQAVIKANITNDEVPILRSFEPGQMGAYQNEADANESNFQKSFWGVNYARLLSIKAIWDPTGMFIVNKGVGSEFWNADTFCFTPLFA